MSDHFDDPHHEPGLTRRVATVLVSPYSKPKGVTNVIHDHTSVLATVESKWNLPALTFAMPTPRP